MTLDEFYSLSTKECFERIKDESRSQAKQRLCGGVIILLLALAAIAYIVIRKPQEYEYYTNTFHICILSIFCVAALWFSINNLRFLLLEDRLDTPKDLLYRYELMVRNNRNALWVLMVAWPLMCYPDVAYHFKYLDLVSAIVFTVFQFAIVAFLFFKCLLWQEYKTRRDEEITDLLQDLIDRK